MRSAITADYQFLLLVARRVARPPLTVADVAHQAIARMLRSEDSYQHRGHFRAWAAMVVMNTGISMGRRERTQRAGPLEDWRAPPQREAQIDHLDLAETCERFLRLSPGQFRSLAEMLLLDVGHQDIADRDGTALGTAKSRLSRARQALAQDPSWRGAGVEFEARNRVVLREIMREAMQCAN